jgi:hypothetical protein
VSVGDPLAERGAERPPYRQHVVGGVGDEPAGRVSQHRSGGVALGGVGHVQHPRLALGAELHQPHGEGGSEHPRPVVIERGGFHVQPEHRLSRSESCQCRRVQFPGPGCVHRHLVLSGGAQVTGHAARRLSIEGGAAASAAASLRVTHVATGTATALPSSR